MLSLFSSPKAFQGDFDIIQRNAITSWSLLHPRPEIILLGNDSGTATMAHAVGARHIPSVDLNEYGTPLVSSIFASAQTASRYDLMCYVNADIILMDDFLFTVAQVNRLLPREPFLLIGRKITGVPIPELLDFTKTGWQEELRRRVSGASHGTSDSDYFVFRRGLWPQVPPFAIGRFYWSAWLVYNARIRGIKVLDATETITAVEPAHDYGHVSSVAPGDGILSSPELAYNARLFKGCRYWTTFNSSHTLSRSELKRIPLRRRFTSLFIEWDHCLGLAYRVSPTWHRALLPVHAAYRGLRPWLLGLRRRLLRQPIY
ncbi:MAG TPA: hypothetical protein VGZ29_15350 [Terriglobia bacterium]|nr:hypothetical protein [Terriglobia bacterium]